MKYISSILFLLNCSIVWGQTAEQLKEIDFYNKATQQAFLSKQFDKAIAYADTMHSISKKYNYFKGKLIYFSLKGKIYQFQGKQDLAQQQYSLALKFIDSTKYENNNAKAHIYKDIAVLFHRQNKIDSSNIYFDKMLDLPCEENTLWPKNHLVTLLRERGNYKKALQTCQEILNCYRANKDQEYLLTNVLKSMSDVYSELGDHTTALQYLDSTLLLAEASKDSLFMILSYHQLGIEHGNMSNHKKAIKWHQKAVLLGEQLPKQKALSKAKKIIITIPISQIYNGLSNAYYNANLLDSAVYYAHKSLLEEYNTLHHGNISEQLVNIAELIIEQKGNYSMAIDSLKKAYQWGPRYRSWSSLQNKIYLAMGRAYAGLNKQDSTLYYYKKAEFIAQKLASEVRLAATYAQIEAFYIEQKNYEKAYKYQTLKIEAEKKVQTRKNQNAILRFEIKYQSKKLKQENLLLAQTQKLQAQELAFNESLNQRNQYIILGLIALILLLIGIAWLIYRQKNLQTQFSIMSLEQKALKAQINPHFFFNVLNSLQGTILSEEPMVAYKYHTKFTKLMRLILMQSDKDGIPLEKEIEALRLYLELEQLRTGSAFEFKITNTVDSKGESIVPSMLLQPFVENAIWHGVMNRTEGEEKKINIHIKKKGQLILCEIEDTGVGRKQADAIKKQKTTMHESMGMKVTQNRLELFQLRYKMALNFAIQDLVAINGDVLGTKVKLEIPTIHI